MILYGEKSFFFDFFFFSKIRVLDKKSSLLDQNIASIAGLRMFVAFLVFAKAPAKWLAALAWSSDTKKNARFIRPVRIYNAFSSRRFHAELVYIRYIARNEAPSIT